MVEADHSIMAYLRRALQQALMPRRRTVSDEGRPWLDAWSVTLLRYSDACIVGDYEWRQEPMNRYM